MKVDLPCKPSRKSKVTSSFPFLPSGWSMNLIAGVLEALLDHKVNLGMEFKHGGTVGLEGMEFPEPRGILLAMDSMLPGFLTVRRSSSLFFMLLLAGVLLCLHAQLILTDLELCLFLPVSINAGEKDRKSGVVLGERGNAEVVRGRDLPVAFP